MTEKKKQTVADAAKAVILDGWQNLFAGMGTKSDKTVGTTYKGGARLGRQELDDLFRYGGFARRVVSLPAFEMTREWFDIEADTEGDVRQYLDTLGARQVFRNALQWADLFGGAVMVMGLDDGGMLDQPLNESGLRAIKFLRVYDRHQLNTMESDIETDPNSEIFGQYKIYTIQPYSGGASFRVHHSRILRFDGADVPDRARQQNQGWGDSVLQAVYEELKNLGVAFNGSANIVQDFIQVVVSIQNLSAMIGAGQEDIVKKRLDLMDLSRSIMNTLLLDAEETYSKQASSVAGLPDLVDRFMLALSGVTGIPVTKLFGQAPAGLNATGEADTRNWYDEVKTRQDDRLAPPLERLVTLVMLCRDGPFKGSPLPDWTIEFCPLWQMTDAQTADYRLKVAQADQIYLQNSVVDPEEIAVARFGGDKYSAELSIDIASREPPEQPEKTDPLKPAKKPGEQNDPVTV